MKSKLNEILKPHDAGEVTLIVGIIFFISFFFNFIPEMSGLEPALSRPAMLFSFLAGYIFYEFGFKRCAIKVMNGE